MDADGNLTGIDVLKAIGVAIVISGTVLFFFEHEISKQEEYSKVVDAKHWAYIAEHKCERTGFAGKHAIPVYQCDNGLWLSTEIRGFVNPRNNK